MTIVESFYQDNSFLKITTFFIIYTAFSLARSLL